MPATMVAVIAELDAATKALENAKARLANTLDLLQRAEANNARMSHELRHAHREIAALESERDTWRAAAER